MKICCVVVTFNRKKLLLKCLDNIRCQTFKPHTVLIVDNASTDGTLEAVKSNGFYEKKNAEIYFKYLRLESNQGGAGGFYNGMKTAQESSEHFDGIWVMDDDGTPDADCLERLVNYLPKYDFMSPLVVSTEDSQKLAFNYKGELSVKKITSDFIDLIPDFACPFNGILYSRKLVGTIGYPIPQLFIWGDECNYTMRAKDAGFIPYTVILAVHRHPSDRMNFGKSIFGIEVVEVPNKWRGYCYWRNTVFNHIGRWNLSIYVKYYIIVAYYLLFKKRDFSMFLVFNDAFFSGFKKNPDDGYKKYMGA